MNPLENARKVTIVGAGYAGLAAAHELAKAGCDVTIVEKDDAIGGLAGSFPVGGTRLEKFYHHWFTNDAYINALVDELGLRENVVARPTQTGSFYANSIFRLAKPLDLLKYTPLSLFGRFRLGFLVIQARLVRDWRSLESWSAADWLRRKCGAEVYAKVWEPLLLGKFGRFADEVGAVWFWNKLVLRGGSRGKGGNEVLAYYKGGFAALADTWAERLQAAGVKILLSCPALALQVENGTVTGIETSQGTLDADAVLVTTALPILSDLVAPHAPASYIERLSKIRYLGNMCLVLQLDQSLSSTYWLNVSDPGFPFVGVIEHTNFEPPSSYAGRHIVYLSKYIDVADDLYASSAEQFLDYAVPYLKRIFPDFQRKWVKAFDLFKADYAQPIITRRYSAIMPEVETPVGGLYLCTMAQVYPEDRGTNYAVREGRAAGRMIVAKLLPAGRSELTAAA